VRDGLDEYAQTVARAFILKAIAAELPSFSPPFADPLATLPRIAGVALAHPETSYTQEQVLERLGLAEDEFARRIFGRCGVRRRRLTLSDDFLSTTVQGRTPAIERQLLAEAVRAVDELAVDPAEIGVVVTSSLYTLAGPTLAHRLIEHYGMDPATDKYHVVGVGCASAVPLVRLASQTLREHPGKKALVVAAESMSGILTRATEGDERSKTVGCSIFGDGCAAALIEIPDSLAAGDASVLDPGGEGVAGAEPVGDGPVVVASKVHQVAGTLDAVRMQLAAQDSYLHLIRELPDVAAKGLGELVDDFLDANDLERVAIDRWLLHPGGRRIIESLQGGLGLTHEQAQSSYDVLAEHGNIGTPAIFYVLERSLEQRSPQDGEHALMVTVGPGVTVGLMLLRW
jgi:predicted naringenin-chalcone synthase